MLVSPLPTGPVTAAFGVVNQVALTCVTVKAYAHIRGAVRYDFYCVLSRRFFFTLYIWAIFPSGFQ